MTDMGSCTAIAQKIACDHPVEHYRGQKLVSEYTTEIFGPLPEEDKWVDVVKRIFMAALAPIMYVSLGLISLFSFVFRLKNRVDYVKGVTEIEDELAHGSPTLALGMWKDLKSQLPFFDKPVEPTLKFVRAYNILGRTIRAKIAEEKKQRSARGKPFAPPPFSARSTSDPLRGLPNLGNTCFANALAQALFIAPQSLGLLTNSITREDAVRMRYNLAEIKILIQHDAQQEVKATGMEHLLRLFPAFNDGRQHCARELAQVILTRIGTFDDPSKGFCQTTLRTKAPPAFIQDPSSPISYQNPHLVTDPLYPCLFSLTTPLDQEMPLQEQLESLLLTPYTYPSREAESAFRSREEVTFLTRSSHTPKNLILCLKKERQVARSTFISDIRKTPGVTEPVTLPVHRRQDSEFIRDGSLTYTPYAWVVHSGGLFGGHWTAYVKDAKTGALWEYNDRVATPVDPASVKDLLEQSSAAIFYSFSKSS